MTLRIKRRTQPGWLIWLLIVLPFFLSWLPDGAKYLLDAAWAALLIFLLRFRKRLDWPKLGRLPGWAAAFLLFTLLAYLPQYQSGLYYLWGLRNNFRFYAAFFAFALFLTPGEVEDYWRLLDKLFWLNAALSLLQFYGFGIKGDYLGGLFGTEQGCNGYTNLFFAVVITKTMVYYLEKRETGLRCAAKCVAALYLAALAELKFFFVEFLVIAALAVLSAKVTWRKLLLLAGGCIGAAVFAGLLSVLFPEFSDWFSLGSMLRTAAAETGYASVGDLNRLTAVSGINARVFETWSQRLFGLGLGNCERSNFPLLTTPFYRRHAELHYTWMSVSFVYLELGWLGLVFFFGFFALVFFAALRRERQGGNRADCRIGRILAVLCVMIGVYNSSLRMESGYLAYFALALPFVGKGRTT